MMATITDMLSKRDIVRSLVDMNGDAGSGLRKAAEVCTDEAVSARFERLAEQHDGFVRELRTLSTEDLSGEPGTPFGALHRTWIDIRSKLNGGDKAGLAAEIERGEAALLQVYDGAIEKCDDSQLKGTLAIQRDHLTKASDEIKQLAQ